MLSLRLPQDKQLRVLCIGAHSDDIEIGCGGSILRLIQEHTSITCQWVVFSGTQERANEARISATSFLKGAQQANIVLLDFKDGFFPYHGPEIKTYFETLKQFNPSIIFTHYSRDAHQDHRLLAELTWNTFRNHCIFEYEIPKYDGDIGNPNCFFHLSEELCKTKVQLLQNSFVSQQQKAWFSDDTFFALLRLRGMESASPTKYAEAFYCRKLVL